MVHCVRWIFPVLLAGCFAAVTSAGGSEKPARFFPVKDEGEFFKDLSKPNQIIREIQERHHKEVLVHTHRAVKTEDRDKVEKMTPDERAKYFLDWAKKEAKDERLNGVGILICKRPQGKFNVVVEVGDKTAASFTQADQRKVRDLLVKNFDAKKYDEGLVSGLEYIRDTLNVNPPPRVAEQKGGGAAGGAAGGGAGGGGRRAADEPANFWSTPVGWVCIGLLVLLGLWLIMRVLGAIFAPRPAYGAPGAGGGGGGGYGGGGGGGGFFSSLLGGLFGAAAGMWLYNNMFGGSTAHAYGGQPGGGSADAGGGAGAGEDYTGVAGEGGGDAGEGGGDAGEGGGGEAGGGEGGGGDWGGGGDAGGGGGGDAGGGGDWGGGGGGDWGGGGGGGDWGGGGGGGDW